MPKLVLGLPPAIKQRGQLVAFDFEIFRKGPRFHIPDGELACLVLASPLWGETVYMVKDIPDVRRALKRVAGATLAAHNAPFDLRYLRRFGVEIEDLSVWDTEVAEKVMFSGLYSRFGLDDVVRRRYNFYMDKRHGAAIGAEDHPLEMTPGEEQYAVFDAFYTSRLAADQITEMDDELTSYFHRVERDSMMAMLRMPPIPVDEDFWLELAEEKRQTKERLAAELGFNPGSPAQVMQHVLAHHNIELPNTQAETLEEYQHLTMVQAILAYREAATAANTYGPSWLEQNVVDGHTLSGIRCFGAVTGRWSSEAPNMQNIPVRKDHRYRLAFPASPGHKRVKVDADMQEPRCGAYLSRDAFLLDQLRRKIKLHVSVMRVMGKNPELTKADDPALYDQAKIVHLATWYGAGPEQIARQTGVSVKQATEWQREIFRMIPGIKAYQVKQASMVHRLGYVRTASNRIIHINPDAPNIDQVASDFPIQGTAAEITKRAVALIAEMGDVLGHDFYVDLVVHDETTANVPTKEAKAYAKLMHEAWMHAADEIIHGIPFDTEIQIGRTWGG